METQEIRKLPRWVLGGASLALVGSGGYATLSTQNGAGAAALVAGGILAGILAMIGHWPSRISVAGSEMSWAQVDAAVNSQIAAARDTGESQAVIDELIALRKRIDELRRTGTVPEHPAEGYDKSVEEALRRIAPNADVRRSRSPRLDTADFTVAGDRWAVNVETKWRNSPSISYRGTTLSPLIEKLAPDASLLVVVNATEAALRPALTQDRGIGGDRFRIVAWRDERDDRVLEVAFEGLVERQRNRY